MEDLINTCEKVAKETNAARICIDLLMADGSKIHTEYEKPKSKNNEHQ